MATDGTALTPANMLGSPGQQYIVYRKTCDPSEVISALVLTTLWIPYMVQGELRLKQRRPMWQGARNSLET